MDHIKEIKEIVAEQAYEQLKHNLEHVNTKELGEVIDMIKDTAEAAYYCSVVEAMEKAEEETRAGNTVYYTERYLPPYRTYPREKEDEKREIPYYDYKEPVARDLREGRSPISRRMYMTSKERHEGKEIQLQELEKYMTELGQDVTEMIADSTPEEKQMLHKRLAALTTKVESLIK